MLDYQENMVLHLLLASGGLILMAIRKLYYFDFYPLRMHQWFHQ